MISDIRGSVPGILRQSGTQHLEPTIALQVAITNDIPCHAVRLENLGKHRDALRAGSLLPIGSVEFVRAAMALAGIEEPANISYPDVLHPYLHRNVHRRRAGSVIGHWFIKPVTTKAFTGFVFDTLGNPDHLSGYDRAQYNAFLALDADALVWVSDPVAWQSEYRFYVIDGKVRGEGRYDDGPDNRPVPDFFQVGEMAATLSSGPDVPAAFSLDVGVLASGETALIECNDAWALGFYKGTLSRKDYVEMLWCRWNQLIHSTQLKGAG